MRRVTTCMAYITISTKKDIRKHRPSTQALLDERLLLGCLLSRRRPSVPILILLRRPLGISSSTDGRVGTLTWTSVEEPAVDGASSVASLV